MHVALVSPAWPLEGKSNGIVTYVHWLREGLEKEGCRVSVLAFEVDEACRDPNVYRIDRADSMRRLFNRLTGRSSTYDGGYRIATTLRRLHRSVPVDIVEMEESFGWAINVSRSTRLPLVVKLHGPAFLHLLGEDLRTSDGRAKVRREGASLAHLPVVVSPSRRHLEETLSHYGIQPAVAEQVVNPLGLVSDVPLWNRTDHDAHVLLFVGRFDSIKGGDSVILSFRKLLQQRPHLRLVFVGPDRGLRQPSGRWVHIAEFIAELGDPQLSSAISVRGTLAPDEICRLRAKAACVIVASRRESQGYTALEAMLQGCPVVCTDAYGLDELIFPRVNGMKAKAGDADDLARQIACLLDDTSLAERLGGEARRYVLEHHDPQAVARAVLRIYRRTIALSSGSS